MDAGTTSAYRNRKRHLNGRPCNPKVKRRLFPPEVPSPDRRAAEMDRPLLKRQRRVVARAGGLVDAAADTMCLLVEMGWYSFPELNPLFLSLRRVVSDAMHACEAAVAPMDVDPVLYYDSPGGGDDDDGWTGCSSPPSFVESGAAFVPVDTVRSKRRAKANSKYYGPEWSKK
ncbi:uncharacterized protein [Lolium perenne]|uniref:uncharacterized protein n=1 Tax=Lolium perenne TaxID=4522 RepID=UPI0021EA52C4|nr:uncharacterized protein LOC127294068 [Lolium perenne]